ncbi:MAG: hypothetical protein Q8914_07640 [Bacteroidota bacterium]|nr:hypothetical protein [Bacteroidota bacterium]
MKKRVIFWVVILMTITSTAQKRECVNTRVLQYNKEKNCYELGMLLFKNDQNQYGKKYGVFNKHGFAFVQLKDHYPMTAKYAKLPTDQNYEGLGLIDTCGTFVVKPVFWSFSMNESDTAIGYINYTNQGDNIPCYLINFEKGTATDISDRYDFLKYLSEDRFIFYKKKGKTVGLLNTQFDTIVAPKFDRIKVFGFQNDSVEYPEKIRYMRSIPFLWDHDRINRINYFLGIKDYSGDDKELYTNDGKLLCPNFMSGKYDGDVFVCQSKNGRYSFFNRDWTKINGENKLALLKKYNAEGLEEIPYENLVKLELTVTKGSKDTLRQAYEYYPSGLLKRITSNNKKYNQTFYYFPNAETPTAMTYLEKGDTFRVNIDTRNGLAYSESTVNNQMMNFVHEFQYNKQMIREKMFLSDESDNYASKDSITYTIEDGNRVKVKDRLFTTIFEYYPDKLNTLDHAYFGQSYLGRVSKNLAKTEIEDTSRYDYTYEFDKQGRVTKEICVLKEANDAPSTTITIYRY